MRKDVKKVIVPLFMLAGTSALTSALAEVSFKDILKDPDNVQLNTDFARERLTDGDAKAALSAIERVLAQEPANLPARLFRARVLLALGSDLQAESELEALNIVPLPDNISSQITKMLNDVKRRKQRIRSQLSFRAGYVSGDNVNNFPTSGLAEINGRTTDFVSNNGARDFVDAVDDDGWLTGFTLYSELDLRNKRNDSIFANITANRVTGSKSKFMDYDSTSVSIGAQLDRFGWILRPSVSYVTVDSDTQPDTEVKVVSLSAERKLTPDTLLFANFSYNERDYAQTEIFSVADNYDNETAAMVLGVAYALGKRTQLSVSVSLEDIAARLETAEYNAKETVSTTLGLRSIVFDGQVLSVSYRHGENNHKAVAEVSDRKREEDINALRISYELFGSIIHPALDGFRLVANYTKHEKDANIVQYANDRKTQTLMLNYTKRF